VRPRILLVDHEQELLDGYERSLGKEFDVATASCGRRALETIAATGPFAVVVSGFRMPEMDGVQFLSEVARRSPDSARIMLTGRADVKATIASINQARVLRFLVKPCSPEALATSLRDGVEHHRLVQAERELLERTLRQTVQVLIEVLGLVDPDAYSASAKLRDLIAGLCRRLGLADTWRFELAAMLSQLGTIALPPAPVARFRTGEQLGAADMRLIEGHPQSAYNLLVRIPRLELVARMVLAQERPPMSRPLRHDRPDDDDLVAMGAHLLNVAIDYRRLRTRATGSEAIATMRGRGGPPFRQSLLDALEAETASGAALVVRRRSIDDLEPGNVLNEDVRTHGSVLLLAAGQELTTAHLQRLRRFATGSGVPEPIEVLVPEAGAVDAA
jgi:FixJ family two-component response regulator